MITQKRLKEVLRYNRRTGFWTWKVFMSSRALKGARAGSTRADGNVRIRIDGKLYLAHRLAHLYVKGVFPSAVVDHKNGDASKNRWSNLRPTTQAKNCLNKKKNKRNTSGYTGVRPHRKNWQALICTDGKVQCLGTYRTKKEANAVRVREAKRQHGEFMRARGG